MRNNHNNYAELRVIIDKNKKVYSKINGDISSLIFMHNAALHEILKLLEKELKDGGIILAIGDIIVGIDIGTSKVCTILWEVNNFGQIEII